MSPAITSGLVLSVLFTVFILFSKSTIENNVEISQDVNNAAVNASEKLSTNLVMTSVQILDGCNFQATVENQGTTDIQNFKDMNVLIDFPEEPGVNNENIVLNYTTSDSLNPGEWTHTINPNLNLTPNSRDINPSCCGKYDPMDDDDEKQVIVFASNRDTNDGNHEIYSISVYGGNETRLTNNLTNDQFPSWSPDGTKIVFGTNRDGNYEIYTMNSDGTNQTRLTNHPNTDYYPSWSHDGTKIAFTSWRNGNGEIYTMNADGTNQTNITNNINEDSSPSWSPDGLKIAFMSQRDGNDEIYTMNPDGSNLSRITNNPTGETYPVWSHDGSKIVFYTNRHGNDEIYFMNSDGSNQTRVTDNLKTDRNASWSPDGLKIAFQTDRDGNFEIYFTDVLEDTSITRLTNNGSADSVPSLSPDGTKITFQSQRDGNWEIYTMNADGTNPTNVTNNVASDGFASWSPDGAKIVFHSSRDGNWEIYTMNADGTNPTRITNNSWVDVWPHWSPDGNKITFMTNQAGNYEIYTMNTDGTNRTRITNHIEFDADPAFSPDGTKIAFRTSRDGNNEIYTINADGTNPTRLTTNISEDLSPAWSPDGTKIVFQTQRDGNWEIYTMNADGTNQTRLINHPNTDSEPIWSPDGTKIVFVSDRDGNNEIYQLDLIKLNEQKPNTLHNLTNDNYDDLSEKFSIKEAAVLNPGETMNIKGRATLSTGTSTDPRWLINLISDTGVKASKTGSQVTYLNGMFRTPDNRSLFGTADTVLYNKDGWIPVQSLDNEWRTASGAAEIVLNQEGKAHGMIGESYLDLELPYDGIYLIEVGSNGTIRPGNNTSVGNYNIIVNNQFDDNETPDIGDSTNEGRPIPQGAQEINPGEWKFGEINTEDDVDWWALDGTKGEQITIKISYTNHQSIADWVSGLEGFTFKLYNYKTSGSINC